ncbi:hypothetical protein GCM10009759_02040 [Kitasatospora saccharophila]|uniref:Uncharacterized protein n=1 Tax=Kitasatospora saccharophila TaxID=407973 RepID=A0ABN2W4T5_9ACTN
MRSVRRLIASVALLGAALFFSAGPASADSVWQYAKASKSGTVLEASALDSVWQ